MNVTKQARVGKDQVGNGVETTNHNSRALVQTTEKELKSVRYGKSSHRSKSFAVISWNCCRSTAVFTRVESLSQPLSSLSHSLVASRSFFIAPLERRTML